MLLEKPLLRLLRRKRTVIQACTADANRWAEGTHRKLTNDITKETGPQVHHHTPRGDAHRRRSSAARLVGRSVCGARPAPVRVDATFRPAASPGDRSSSGVDTWGTQND